MKMADRTTWLLTHRGFVADVVTGALRAVRLAYPADCPAAYPAREAAMDAMVDLEIARVRARFRAE